MRNLVNWQDQEVEYPNRYVEQDLGNGMIQHTPAFGRIRNQGTPQNAANFNTMDLAAFEAMLMGAEALLMISFLQDSLEDEKSSIKVTKEDLRAQGDKLEKAISDLNDTLSKEIAEKDAAQTHTSEILRNTINEVIRSLRLTENAVIDETGFFVTVKLTNSQTYPFNNSQKTIAFPTELIRQSADYSVTPEIVESDGFVKDIEITDKLLNGFKVKYTGSAKSATLKLYVKGGKSSLNGLPHGITA